MTWIEHMGSLVKTGWIVIDIDIIIDERLLVCRKVE